MRINILIGLFTSIMLHTSAMADSWSFEKKSSDTVHVFGKTKIILTLDAVKNQHYPDYILKIFEHNKLLAQYRNVAFQDIFSSKDNKMFVGLSNSGLPGTTIVVFDDRGNLLLEIKHDFGSFYYCSKSITLERVWYNQDNPGFNFGDEGNNLDLKGMTLVDCKGKIISFYDVISKAYNRPIRPTR